MSEDANERARVCLEGVSVADAFGEQLLHAGPHARALMLDGRVAPVGRRWMWTDDTIMAVSIVENLAAHGGIDCASLATAFAERYNADAGRGYGRGAHQVLDAIWHGLPYDVAARLLFEGQGSMGNGGGMRSAPIGAYFRDDLAAVVEHARRSAAPTHAHPEGAAGAIAVAVAAARVFAGERDPRALLAAVVEHTPAGETRSRLARALPMLGAEPLTVATELGNGAQVISADTIPFAVWCAATHLDDYAGALWACGEVGGDIDTTCAIAGGIVVGAVGLAGIPAAWHESREPLPAWYAGRVMPRRALLAMLLALAACEAKEPACSDVSMHVGKMFEPTDAYAQEVEGIFLARCVGDAWSAEVKRCLASTTSLADPKNCKAKLSATQAAALDQELALAEEHEAGRVLPKACLDLEVQIAAAMTCEAIPAAERARIQKQFALTRSGWDKVTNKQLLAPTCGAAIAALKQATNACRPGASAPAPAPAPAPAK